MTQTIQSHGNSVPQLISSQKADKDKSLSAFSSILDTPELKNLYLFQIGDKLDSVRTVAYVGPYISRDYLYSQVGYKVYPLVHDMDTFRDNPDTICIVYDDGLRNFFATSLDRAIKEYSKGTTASILDTPELRDFSINPYELKVGDMIGNGRKIVYVGPYINEEYIEQQTPQSNISDGIDGDYLRAHPETICVVYIIPSTNEAHVFTLKFVLDSWKDMIKRASILDSISPVATTFQEFIDMAKPWQVWKSLSPTPSDARIYLLIGENATFNIRETHLAMKDVAWVNQFSLDNSSTKPSGDWIMQKENFPMELLPQEWDTSHISSILDTPELRFPVQIGELWKFKSNPNCIIKITWIGEWIDHPSQDYYREMGNEEFANDDICVRSQDIESSSSYYTDSLSDFLLIHVPVDSSDKVSSILELPEFSGVYSEFAGLSVGDVVNTNSGIPFKISFIGRFDAIPQDMNIQYDFQDPGFIPLNKISDIIVVYQDNRQGENATYWYGEIFQFIKHYKPVIQSHAAISSISFGDSEMIVKDDSTTAITAKIPAKSATVVSSDSKSSSILELPEFSGDLYPHEGEIWEDKDAAYPFKYEIVYVGLFSNHPEPDAIGPMASNFKDTCVRIKRLSNNGTGTYAINDFLRLFKPIDFNTTSSILEVPGFNGHEAYPLKVGDTFIGGSPLRTRTILYVGPVVNMRYLEEQVHVQLGKIFNNDMDNDLLSNTICVVYKTTDNNKYYVQSLDYFMNGWAKDSEKTASILESIPPDEYQGIAVGDEYKDRDFTIRKVLYIGPFVSLTHLNQYLPVHMTFLFFSATPTDIVVGYKTDTVNCFVMKLNKFMRVVNTSTRTASVNPNLIKDDQLRYI